MDENEDATEKEAAFLKAFGGYREKRPYKPVFGKPEGNWRVEANWEDAYYGAASAIVTGVVDGRYPRAVEGVAGLYLFRHYLELSLKYIVLHARWLKDQERNAEEEEIKAVKKTHSLRTLWDMAKAEGLPKIEEEDWRAWDIEFVDACIAEFDAVDPDPGERFRYHGKSFGGRNADHGDECLWIDFARLLRSMPHVREVLGAIDLWLYETHGQNQEWEAEMRSWGD